MSSETKIKICGLRRKEDVDLAAELGAWALGFIFFQESPRSISAREVESVTKNVTLKKVGVFVNSTIGEIVEVAKRAGLDTAQLHGDESPQFCEDLHHAFPELSIIKAIRPRDPSDLKIIADYKTCEAILIDTYTPALHGGTGVTGDWESARKVAQSQTIILSGGLKSENVKRAIEIVQPWAVDVSSGIEKSPGVKDHTEMRRFFLEVRGE